MRLAARGARDLDDGRQEVKDTDLAAALRRQARRIHAKALLVAALATPLFLLL